MKADIRDTASLLALRPLDIASYLRASGWRQVDSKETLYAVCATAVSAVWGGKGLTTAH